MGRTHDSPACSEKGLHRGRTFRETLAGSEKAICSILKLVFEEAKDIGQGHWFVSTGWVCTLKVTQMVKFVNISQVTQVSLVTTVILKYKNDQKLTLWTLKQHSSVVSGDSHSSTC